LQRAPVLAITSFLSIDADGVETDIEEIGSPVVPSYELREASSRWPRVAPLSGAAWTTGTLAIEFRAGYADRLGSPQQGAEMVPTIFKQAIKFWVEAMYDRDEKMMPLLLQAAERMLKPHRVYLGVA
jgi:hypothetical protein